MKNINNFLTDSNIVELNSSEMVEIVGGRSRLRELWDAVISVVDDVCEWFAEGMANG